MIPESKNTIPSGFRIAGPFLITPDLFRVLPAIRLDDQSFSQADKINNIRPDSFLAPEFATGQLPAAEMLPEPMFGFRRRLSKAARSRLHG
jgi:hypothetical protein